MYNDEKASNTMTFNRLIRALGKCIFLNHYFGNISWFLSLFVSKSSLIKISKSSIIILLEVRHLFLP